ncbi:uncharacterized protein SEPMUDRAFT_34955, partial [Sphaerulina musiva SO2202]
VGLIRIARLRKEIGLYKRILVAYREEAELGIVEVLRKELEDGGIKDLSRRMLYEYIRSKYNIVSRDRLYRVLDTLNPEAVRRRRVKAK